MAKNADDQLRNCIRVDKITDLFRRLDEDYNGHERRVIEAYLKDRNTHEPCTLAMGVLEALGIESAAQKHKRYEREYWEARRG